MYKKILQLAFPIILTNVLQLVYQMTDLYWIGKVSKEGIAAISVAGPILFFFVSLGIGLAIAGNILVAQYKGKWDYEMLNKITGQSFLLTTLFSLVISGVGFFLSRYLVGRMDVTLEVWGLTIAYLKISFLGMVAVFGMSVIQSVFRGLGEVKIPFYIMLGSVILNMVLDPIFILYYDFGVNGAAYTTIITQSLALFCWGFFLYRKQRYHLLLEKKYFVIHTEFIKRYLKLAIPSWIEMSVRALWAMFIAYLVADFWTDVTAVYGVWVQVFNIVMFIAIGFSTATMILVGQNFWNNNFEKIKQIKYESIRLATGILFGIGVIIFLFAQPIVTIFLKENPELIPMAVHFVKIMAISFWALGIQYVVVGMLRGFGEAKSIMVLTIILMLGLIVPFIYFGKFFLAEEAIWRSFSLPTFVIAWLAWVLYKRKSKDLFLEV